MMNGEGNRNVAQRQINGKKQRRLNVWQGSQSQVQSRRGGQAAEKRGHLRDGEDRLVLTPALTRLLCDPQTLRQYRTELGDRLDCLRRNATSALRAAVAAGEHACEH